MTAEEFELTLRGKSVEVVNVKAGVVALRVEGATPEQWYMIQAQTTSSVPMSDDDGNEWDEPVRPPLEFVRGPRW